ncbi:MAG: putative transport system permease protein [Acidobacteriaceae bacterium]|nr:putative transport system permease protein [Acidobacteriaceae bacterium]MEA2259868.1 putative transport system permease protein [Acidobacteriaceae bacterium]
MVNSVLVRPLSYPHAERIVQTEKVTTTGSSYTASIPLFLYWRDHNRTLQHLAAYSVLPVGFNLAERAMPERIPGLRVSADFFRVLGVMLPLGRNFTKRTINLGRSASSFLEKASGIADTTMTVRLSANRFGSMESRTLSLEFCRWDFSFLAPCRRQPQLKSGPRSNCRPQAAIHAVYSNASGG